MQRPLVTPSQSMPRLEMACLPLAGVDFHCSDILEMVLELCSGGGGGGGVGGGASGGAAGDMRLQAQRGVHALLGGGRTMDELRAAPLPAAVTQDLKRIMWELRSGLNCRNASFDAEWPLHAPLVSAAAAGSSSAVLATPAGAVVSALPVKRSEADALAAAILVLRAEEPDGPRLVAAWGLLRAVFDDLSRTILRGRLFGGGGQ